MNTSFRVTNVRIIAKNVAKPVVVFEQANKPAVLRNPKQALIDLQNSGRALGIDEAEFANGYENVSHATKAEFIEALLDTIGATITADLTYVKAGDKYAIGASHPALTDKKHPSYGKVKKAGDTLLAEKDGVWVEGFMSIPLTQEEKMNRSVSREVANIMAKAFGGFQSAPATSRRPLSIEEEEADALNSEAFGG